MPTLEQLELARQKALESPNIGKRGKGKKTIAQERRQEIFDEIVSEQFEALIKEARAEYKLDRFMGKIPDKIEVAATVTGTIAHEVLQIAEEELKRRKLNEQPKNISPPALPLEDKGDVLL